MDSSCLVDIRLLEKLKEKNQIIASWTEECRRQYRNVDYYRGLVIEIGRMFGLEAYVADDGSVQDDILCAKVPELVRKALTNGIMIKLKR